MLTFTTLYFMLGFCLRRRQFTYVVLSSYFSAYCPRWQHKVTPSKRLKRHAQNGLLSEVRGKRASVGHCMGGNFRVELSQTSACAKELISQRFSLVAWKLESVRAFSFDHFHAVTSVCTSLTRYSIAFLCERLTISESFFGF